MAGKKGRSGRKPEATGYRAWCRSVADRPEIRAKILARALEDPDFALRLAEHGYGRPPQALDVRLEGDSDSPLCYRALPEGGDAHTAPALGIPAAHVGQHGPH